MLRDLFGAKDTKCDEIRELCKEELRDSYKLESITLLLITRRLQWNRSKQWLQAPVASLLRKVILSYREADREIK